jgi:hypothetical protein
LDLVVLIESLGLDPLKYVDKAIIQIRYFLQIHEFTEYAAKWIKQPVGNFDRKIARLAGRMEALSD